MAEKRNLVTHDSGFVRSSKLSNQRFTEGYWAYKVGKLEKDCPYKRVSARKDWVAGWLKAEQEAGK